MHRQQGVSGICRQRKDHQSLMEEVACLAQRFASRIEAIRTLQLPRFPGPPPVGLITQPATATAASSTPTSSRPQVMGSPMTEASGGQMQPSSLVGTISSPPGAADELPAPQQISSPQQSKNVDAPAVAGARVLGSTVPRLDLAAMHSGHAMPPGFPEGPQQGHLSASARVRLWGYHDPDQMEDEMVKQQQHLETGRVKIEGQLDSVNVMVEDWQEPAGPLQTSQPVQNALQV